MPAAAPALPAVFNQLGQPYVLTDRDWRIVDVNEVFLSLTGYTREEVLGQLYYELFIVPAERVSRREAYLKNLAQEQLGSHYERVLPTRDGLFRILQWQTGLVRDPTGTVTGVWSVGEAPGSVRGPQPELAGEDAQLQEFLDNAQDLVQHLRLDNSFLFVNKAWKEKLGYTDEQLATRTLADIVHPYYKAKLLYQLRNLYDGEPGNKVETVFLTSAGKPVHLIGSMTVVREQGQPVSSRAILHDITNRIRAERLQKVYYSIANLAISAKDLASLYGAIHRELSKIIETSNLFIALCDDARTQLQFVYHVDQHPQHRSQAARPFSSGMSEYIIQGGQPRYLTHSDIQELANEGAITAYGLLPEVMLASPLSVGDRIIGVIAVQDYQQADAYSPGDLDVLHFISNQVALAIERKRNEEHISKQSARLNAIFESGTHVMWTVDIQGNLTTFNRNYAALFLRRNGTYPERGLNLLEHDYSRMAEPYRDAFITHYKAANNGEAQHFEAGLRDSRGQEVWADVHLNPIYLGDGSFEEISAIAHDVTDQKRVQLELKAQEEKFRSIFESFQDIYYRTDEEGIITIISPSVQEVLGYAPGEVQGQHVGDYFINPADRKNVATGILKTGGLRNFETQMHHKDGHAVSVLISGRALANGGAEGIARDVTEMHQMQEDLRLAKDEAESALEAKTLFLANMSHELRTPMNGIIGMIDLLDQTVETDEQIEYVDTLRKSSDALLTILNDILDLSKMQAGKMQLHAVALEVRAVMERIRSLFIYRAEQKQIRFTYHITPHTPRFVVTDEVRLLQILSNLVANAIKFTNEGTVSIVVSSVAIEDGMHTLRFAVQDSGIGISAADAALLFTNFTQLDTTPSKAYGGTGLGLAISRELAEMLGGQIGVLSDVGQGSIFWFTIRCAAAQADEMPAALPARSAVQRPFALPPKVLLVDDNAINQKVGQRLLAKLGCEVDIASDGPEAIARATSVKPGYDIIFMDIQMPDMDGVTATREIRLRLGQQCPPVVAMTAYSMQEDAGRFMRQGLDDYVGKPVKSRHLYEVLHRWVRPAQSAPSDKSADFQDEQVEELLATPTLAAPAETAAPPVEVVGASETQPPPPTLDVVVLRQLLDLGGPEFTTELYQEFEEEAGQLLRDAAPLVAASDFKALLPILHQLKGTAGTLGGMALAAQARYLENQLKEDRTQGAVAGFQLLEHYFVKFVAEYPLAMGPAADSQFA